MRFLTYLFFALLASGQLHAAETPEKQLKAFISAAREAAAKLPPAPADGEAVYPRNPQAAVPIILDQLARQPTPITFEFAQGPVSQITALLHHSEKVRLAGDKLTQTLVRERDARLNRYRSEVEALLKTSAQACLNAKSPADLDASLKALAPYQRPADFNRGTGFDAAAQQRAAQMFQFVTRWQDYLGSSLAGDAERVSQILSDLRNQVDPLLISRSILFKLEAPLSPVPSPSKPVNKTPLPPLLTRLETARSFAEIKLIAAELQSLGVDTGDRDLLALVSGLQDLLSAESELQNGKIFIELFVPVKQSTLFTNRYCTPRLRQSLQQLNLQLKDKSLRTVFNDSGLVPAPDESTDDYILRVAQAAATAENWEYALRTLEFYQALYAEKTPPAWVNREILSCTSYVAARRLDEAAQWPQAILAYHEALRAAGRLTPSQLIKDRLSLIKAAQPEAFTTAAKLPRVVYLPSAQQNRNPFNRPDQTFKSSSYLVPLTEHPFK